MNVFELKKIAGCNLSKQIHLERLQEEVVVYKLSKKKRNGATFELLIHICGPSLDLKIQLSVFAFSAFKLFLFLQFKIQIVSERPFCSRTLDC